VATDVGRHLDELRERLRDWTTRVGTGMTEEDFSRSVRADLAGFDAQAYEVAMPFWQSYAGLERYREQHRAS
jgi:hypothetical protein